MGGEADLPECGRSCSRLPMRKPRVSSMVVSVRRVREQAARPARRGGPSPRTVAWKAPVGEAVVCFADPNQQALGSATMMNCLESAPLPPMRLV